jgi:hypothetical protein
MWSLTCGIIAVNILYISSCGSPTERPPTAYLCRQHDDVYYDTIDTATSREEKSSLNACEQHKERMMAA